MELHRLSIIRNSAQHPGKCLQNFSNHYRHNISDSEQVGTMVVIQSLAYLAVKD
ncbi:hypothetical protein BDZ94DRAFT_1258281 [Collybia nuda]|uniref:Uncharacterized protein n=1 Tax=Collybia nuda TaxID=64659 RepID=A0A9P5Y525_9AGAR|nr:hypothetical protein BDZ94DRAFT_1258281 [Collybia nuda]